MIGRDILRAHLNNAGRVNAGGCEDRAKIEVVREDDVIVVPRLLHDLVIRCAWIANLLPVGGFKAMLPEDLNPLRR
jgi:hypothetical protein